MGETLAVIIPVPVDLLDSPFADSQLTDLRGAAVTRMLAAYKTRLVGEVSEPAVRTEGVLTGNGVNFNLADMDMASVRYTFETEPA